MAESVGTIYFRVRKSELLAMKTISPRHECRSFLNDEFILDAGICVCLLTMVLNKVVNVEVHKESAASL